MCTLLSLILLLSIVSAPRGKVRSADLLHVDTPQAGASDAGELQQPLVGQAAGSSAFTPAPAPAVEAAGSAVGHAASDASPGAASLGAASPAAPMAAADDVLMGRVIRLQAALGAAEEELAVLKGEQGCARPRMRLFQ